jgi:hypothetical protein
MPRKLLFVPIVITFVMALGLLLDNPRNAQAREPDNDFMQAIPITKTIDALFDAAWKTKIDNYQLSYASTSTGRKFFQGLATHSTVPGNGSVAAPDWLDRHPTDQKESWPASIFSASTTIPAAVEIHTYDGPSGKGYVIFLRVTINGRLWERAINSGPERYREQAWTIVQPIEP